MKLKHMVPTSPIYDAAYIASLDAKGVGDGLVGLCSSTASDLSNQLVSQDGAMMPLSLLAAMIRHVLHVARSRIPTKVVQSVVAGVSVVVASLMARRAWAYEFLKYKAVYVTRSPSSKHNDQPVVVLARSFDSGWLQLMPCALKSPSVVDIAPDRAVRAYSVARSALDFSIFGSHTVSITQIQVSV